MALPQAVQQLVAVIQGLSPAKRLTMVTLILGTVAGLALLMVILFLLCGKKILQ